MAWVRVRPGLILFALAVVLGTIATFDGEYSTETITPFTVAAVIAIVVGQQLPTYLGQRAMAPLTTAPALGLILSPLDFDGEAPTATTVIGIVWISLLVGALLRRARGRALVEGSLGARFFGMALTAYLAREVTVEGQTLVDWAFGEGTRPSVAALALLVVAAVGGLVERALDNAVVWLGVRQRLPRAVSAEVRPLVGVAAATASAGPLVAMAHPVLDWIAIPLLVLPVFLAQLSVQRVLASRRDLEETMAAMSRLPEVVGCTRTNHSRRVADLSVEIADLMDVSVESRRRIEQTALLHDVGQLGLPERLPGGATIHAPPQTQARIAETSVRIVGSNPNLEDLLPLLDHVGTPFRRSREFGQHIPLEARIVRVANAWDDITEGARTPRARQVALERLHLGLGYDYDPDVVAALERVLGD